MDSRKVLLVELNEITWTLIDPLIERGRLPTFARLKREGTWGAPVSVDLPPMMDPWITWTTVYSGRPQSEHNLCFLEQPPQTIRARRIWEICNENGLRVGVYGSLCSWPPQSVDGFYVPDTFAPDPATHPESLRAIQELNLTYTRSVHLPTDQDGLMFKARLAARLLGLGLKARTAACVARQLAHERWNPKVRWRRVALQPLVNLDFFSRLYLRYRPEFASFHTNHVAHYMHTYWKAMQPEAFSQPASADEVRTFGRAIEYGYRTADALLARMLKLLDPETTLVVASSMGQKPFVSKHERGKAIALFRSPDQLLEILGVGGQAKTLTTMSGQFNIYADTASTRDFIVGALRTAYIDSPGRRMFDLYSVGNCVTVNLRTLEQEIAEDARCFFPRAGQTRSFRYHDLVYDTGLVKSGCHDPTGMILFYGPGIGPAVRIEQCNNLDIAPTLLTLLGVPIPPQMTGRVLPVTSDTARSVRNVG